MSYINELYQEVILDHNRQPRNFTELKDANFRAEGYNPLCGDKVTVTLKVEGERIQEIAFQGMGCAISTASASIMTETLKGKDLSEVEVLFHRFHDLVTGKLKGAEDTEKLGNLAVFYGVSEYPVRVKCATLPWHTLRVALRGESTPVSTE